MTRVARGDLATEIATIKAQPGPDVIAWGGARLAEAPFTFVTDGVAAAVAAAQTLACDRDVTVSGGTIARQCLDLGLLDEVAVDLVPVVMGEGNRPFLGKLSTDKVMLDNPTVCIQGDRVTHLVFPVPR